jgi:TPR repeat protein
MQERAPGIRDLESDNKQEQKSESLGESLDQTYCYDMGLKFYNSDSKLAATYLELAAKKDPSGKLGHADAQYRLGLFYLYGTHGEKNLEKAVELFKQAAEQGHAISQNKLGNLYNELGNLYADGIVVPKNMKKAVEFFRLAAAEQNLNAQCNLGNCLFWGRGVEQNQQQAIELFQKAANQGHPVSQYFLGYSNLNGLGVTKNVNLAYKFFSMLADRGYANGKYGLGICYEKGYGVSKDEKKAVEYYKSAAEQGDVSAALNLKRYYKKTMVQDKKQVEEFQQLHEKGRKVVYSANLLFWANKQPESITTSPKDRDIYVFKRTLEACQVDNNNLLHKKRFATINPECLKVLHEYIILMNESSITRANANTVISSLVNGFDSDMNENNARALAKQELMNIFEAQLSSPNSDSPKPRISI